LIAWNAIRVVCRLLEQDGDRTSQVVARFPGRLADAQDQVDHLGGVELGHLGQRRPDHLDGEVVGTHVLQRALDGPADRRAGGGDDHGFGHGLQPF
jgi:hypothetical protein